MDAALRTAVRRAAEELAEGILPTVLARLRDQTERLQGLAERITADPAHALGDPAGVDSLEADQVLGRRIGWALGVLAAAGGTDLLLARRERDGLRDVLELVVLARPAHAPDPALDALPRLSSSVGEGWEVPLVVASAVWHAAGELAPGAALRWEAWRGEGRLTFRLATAAAGFPAELVELVPGAELGREDGLRLAFPAEWFAPEAP